MQDESGAREKNEDYDYEDEFIDDSEFLEFVGGDRRKLKHSGFFINKVSKGGAKYYTAGNLGQEQVDIHTELDSGALALLST